MQPAPVPIVMVYNAHRRYRIRKKVVEGYVGRVLGARRASISIVFINSHRCKTINRTFLGHNFVTDVVSFCLEEAPVLEGEVYVNLDKARQQAREYRVSFANELARLVIHGTLHLIGYEDGVPLKAKRMRSAEEKHIRHWFPDNLRKERK